MKKVFILVVFFVFSLFLVSCDYPEKDIKLLDDSAIPKEVTRGFTLYKGRLGPITYTVDKPDVFIIENLYDVTIIQSDEDVIVSLEARVKEAFKTFEIKILKTGSDLAEQEAYEDSLIELNELFNNLEINSPYELPVEIDRFTIKYSESNDRTHKVVNNDNKYILVPNLFAEYYNKQLKVKAQFYIEDKFYDRTEFIVPFKYDSDVLNDHEEILKGLNLNLNNYSKGKAKLDFTELILDFNTLESSYEKEFTITLKDYNGESSFYKINNNILEIVKQESVSALITITIVSNNIPMDFQIILTYIP